MASFRRSRGQGMTEYIVITALIGVAGIGAYSYLGQSIRGATAGLALEIAGKDGSTGTTEAGKAADEGLNRAKEKMTLENYTSKNN